jgi:outer membrane receptor protein involved in Fe transport
MGEVVVTASREKEEVTKVPAHVTVISAKDIENSTAQNVPEVLRSAGIHVIDVGGNQRNYNVDLRGFGESSPQNALLLVDGRRVNLPDLSGPDWNLVPIERIERIEVVRGGRGSVLYGDNATAGVINIITKEGAKTAGSVTAAFGSYDTFKTAASLSGALGILGYDFSASYFDTHGYRDNSNSDVKDLGTNLWLDPSDRVRLHLSAGHHYDDTRNPGALLDSALNAGVSRKSTTHPLDFDKVKDYYIKAGAEVSILSNDLFKLEASWRDRDKESYGTYSGGLYWFDADTQSDILTISPQLIFKEDFGGISNTITFGVDYSQAEQEYDSTGTSGDIKAKLEKINSGYFIHDDLNLDNNISLSGGYRYDRAEFKYRPANVRKRKLDEEAFDVGINYAFNKVSHIYASFNRAFRYPVLDEQFSYLYSSVNTSVEPQTSDNYEVGGSIEVAGGLRILANFFRIATEDEIYFNPVSYLNENMEDDTIRQGAELGLDWQLHALRMGATYTYTETEFDDGLYAGNEVPYVPRHQGTAYINYAFNSGLFIGLDANYIGRRYLISDFENLFDKAESYALVNAKIKYDWRWLTFFANLNNIFDKEYSAYSGLSYEAFPAEPGSYPSPGFNVLAGVTARFGGM